MINILIAPDKFKGTLPASEVADIIARGLSDLDARLIVRPMADGGEGTANALAGLTGMEMRHVEALNSAMEPIEGGAEYYFAPDSRIAAIDSSAVLGLGLLNLSAPSPMLRTSYPLGKAMLTIIRNESPTLLYIGIGGTSTVDGGAGMLQAFGYRFFNGDDELPAPITASMLQSVTRIIPPGIAGQLPRIVALSDVSAPLVAPGESPSSLTFAPQKGASPSDIAVLRESLSHFSTLLPPTGGEHDGAGGGLGFALAQIGAMTVAGAPSILEMMDIPSMRPDIIITGEGSLDAQTSLGKVVAALARYGAEAGIPVVAVGGRVLPDFDLPEVTATFSTQLYPPEGCLNHTSASARLSNATCDIRLWLERYADKFQTKPWQRPNT